MASRTKLGRACQLANLLALACDLTGHAELDIDGGVERLIFGSGKRTWDPLEEEIRREYLTNMARIHGQK